MTRFKLRLSVLYLIGFVFILGRVTAQESFVELHNSKDPAPKELSLEERKVIHQEYLQDAIERQDTQSIVFGYLYLVDDYTLLIDMNSAMLTIQKAENFLRDGENHLWKGQLNHKKATMYMDLGNHASAIKYFELALTQSLEGKDNHNAAITYEQLGSIYGYEENFDKSDEYYEKAFDYIMRYCEETTLAVAYANYGNVQSYRGDHKKALEYHNLALDLNIKFGKKHREMICRSNIAADYYELEEYDKALKIWLECAEVSKQNDWADQLILNYWGLSDAYDKLGNSEKALYYLKKYKSLEDSLVGKDVNNEISVLELQQAEKITAQTIEKKDNELSSAKSKYTSWIWYIALAGLFLAMGLLFMFLSKKRQVQQLKKNKERLMELTKKLEAKNAALMEEAIKSPSNYNLRSKYTSEITSDVTSDKINPFTITILTNNDWQSFKMHFEKSHPKFIQVLREAYSDLSEAEERLFLLLKLKLSRREIANILGVLPETVKKTRGRLRKRLQLDSQIDLDEFVSNFK